MAAHLAGAVAAQTIKPVIGVPIDSGPLSGFDALLSTVQMPGGIPVATVAVGKAGAKNAAYLAAQMLALSDPALSRTRSRGPGSKRGARRANRMRALRNCVAEKADTRLLINEAFHLESRPTYFDPAASSRMPPKACGDWRATRSMPRPFPDCSHLKRRSIRKGLILIGADESDFAPEMAALSELDAARVRRTWPGPETWLVPNRQFPSWITGGRASVAVRVPGHVQARTLCCASSAAHSYRPRPIRSDRQPARTELAVQTLFRRRNRLTCCTVNVGWRTRAEPDSRGGIRSALAMTRRFVVIGNPVGHSLSPRIHRMFAEQTGRDLEYECAARAPRWIR